MERLSCLPALEMVGVAGNGPDAVEGIGRSRPDIVILDIRLQTGSGIDVLKQIKKNGEGPRVIIFTNNPLPQYRKKCHELGADFFLHKAKDGEAVTEIVRRMSEEIPGES